MEETLDPQDWGEIQVLGHQMVDDMLEYMQTMRERPPWQHAPDKVRSNFKKPLPLGPQTPHEIYQEFLENILPYPIGNNHPRFWGWVFGTGTALGALAEFLAATMNTNSGGLAYHSANYVENQVINWLKDIMGFPETASGLLTSGCSAANLIGLTVARNIKAEIDIRKDGLYSATKQMVLYASVEIHSSVQKAVEILGLGSRALRYIAVKDDFRINLQELKTRIFEDRQAGYLPFCIVGAAGTTNTGAVDDLNALADICQEEDLWLHVDGAFGAWAVLSSSVKELVSGMERADSLAFDLHKWMYMPYEIGCLLVYQGRYQRESFSIHADYLVYGETNRGLVGDDLPWLSDYGFQLSRAFNSLKAWMSFKEHGIEKYGRLISRTLNKPGTLQV